MRKGILFDILDERQRQVERWGDQNHTLATWLVILAEEFGEVAREVVRWQFLPYEDETGSQATAILASLRRELVQLAAVTVVMIEDLETIPTGPLERVRPDD